MSLCLLAIFKNESHIMNEWLNHYINQGVDHFFLIDNGSDDNYSNILSKYNNITVVIDPAKLQQTKHYNNYLDKCKNYDWVIVCDFDEFIYARRNFKTIKEYLNTLDNDISQVFIPWKIFGSSGFNTIDKKQPDNVIQNFTKRTNYDKKNNFQGVKIINDDKYSLSKCIVRTKYLTSFNIHVHCTTNKKHIGSDNNNFIYDNLFYKINEEILNNSFLHLNHYVIQSYEWFLRVKVARGSANQKINARNERYYREFDNASSDIYDDELKIISNNYKQF